MGATLGDMIGPFNASYITGIRLAVGICNLCCIGGVALLGLDTKIQKSYFFLSTFEPKLIVNSNNCYEKIFTYLLSCREYKSNFRL